MAGVGVQKMARGEVGVRWIRLKVQSAACKQRATTHSATPPPKKVGALQKASLVAPHRGAAQSGLCSQQTKAGMSLVPSLHQPPHHAAAPAAAATHLRPPRPAAARSSRLAPPGEQVWQTDGDASNREGLCSGMRAIKCKKHRNTRGQNQGCPGTHQEGLTPAHRNANQLLTGGS